jgi:hypothetical protein
MTFIVNRNRKLSLGTDNPELFGTVLWDGNLSSFADVTYTLTGSTQFLSSPWPYSSIQCDGNSAQDYGTMSLDSTMNRNSRETKSMKIVMQPNSQRVQPSSRAAATPLNGRWTADDVGTVDLWYGWSMWYHTDWGDNTTLANEMNATYWHDPMALRTSGDNGSMNVSGDATDDDGTGPITSTTSTPRTFYLRRNSYIDQNSSFYVNLDGQGLDKIPMGQAVTGQWMDFVVHVRWSTTSTNALREVWRDGVFMGSKTTANAVDTLEHSWRLGLYQETNINHTRTAWYSNCRIGTSYSAVDPTRTT